MNIQIIEKNGQPEWAVLPYQTYIKLVEQIEMLQDVQDCDRISAALESGKEETVPSEVIYALMDVENPIRFWREYRCLTQQEVAESVGISAPYLSQLEIGKCSPSTCVLKAIAHHLNVCLDDLV